MTHQPTTAPAHVDGERGEIDQIGVRSSQHRPRRQLVGRGLAVALTMALLAAAGCGEDGEPKGATVQPVESTTVGAEATTFETSDYAIRGPAELPAGLTTITAKNTGRETHHLVFARLEPGKTDEDFAVAFAGLNPTGVATLLGGPSGVAPGASRSATIPLTPGEYVVACFIPGHDGMSHFLKGMTTALTVTASDASTELPPSDRTVHLSEYELGHGGDELEGFEGAGTITVTNEGGELHELTVVRIVDGATIDEVIDVASLPIGTPRPDPMPFQGVGGVSFLSRGQSASIDVDSMDLAPGRYALICFIPSPSDRTAHAAKGMVHEFMVPPSPTTAG